MAWRENLAGDWTGDRFTYGLVWGLPLAAMALALLADPGPRTLVWSAALLWMGTACLLNARRCGRTHCRYTGPFYLSMIVPALILGTAAAPAGLGAWLALAAVILFGGKLIWWLSERAWGRFS
jgi:hypothetical protein